MAAKNAPWINQTGLNLIRIVIGSYFMAVSLDLVAGVDQTVIFAPLMSPELADLIASTLLFFISVLFMAGVALRHTSLMLALYVLTSSIIQNFVHFEAGNISDFWRDVTLVCAVMLNYSILDRRQMRRASILTRRNHVRRLMRRGKGVSPRRVTLPAGVTPHPRGTHENAAGFTSVRSADTEKKARPASPATCQPEEEDDNNIFVNI